MGYNSETKIEILNTLENKVSSISNCIVALNKEGYVPNKKKSILLGWCNILIDAYKQIDSLTEEQQKKLDVLYNKIMIL